MTEAAVHHHDHDGTDVFGFWLYILTDCVLFASLFATYLVLHAPGAYGPSLKGLVHLDYILIETFLLLASNFSFGLSMLSFYKRDYTKTKLWLSATFLLGAGFVAMELYEFAVLAGEGYTWYASGAGSAFFTLVGTHGLHVSVGLLWIAIMLVQITVFKDQDSLLRRRLVYLGLFWNFLDIVWIFVFSIVYLMGAM